MSEMISMASENSLGPDQRPAALPPQKLPTTAHKPMPRSCEICHQRKIRCDKRSPCSNCVRGNNFCRYPGTERRPRRPHKTTITDVSARVSQLERTLATIAKGKSRSPKSFQAVEAESTTRDDAENSPPGEVFVDDESHEIHSEERASTEEMLVEDGESSCYVNEVLLFRILAEVKVMKAILTELC
jgi:hypothetical protein